MTEPVASLQWQQEAMPPKFRPVEEFSIRWKIYFQKYTTLLLKIFHFQ